jgi:hypothetical protein
VSRPKPLLAPVIRIVLDMLLLESQKFGGLPPGRRMCGRLVRGSPD